MFIVELGNDKFSRRRSKYQPLILAISLVGVKLDLPFSTPILFSLCLVYSVESCINFNLIATLTYTVLMETFAMFTLGKKLAFI